MNACQVVTSSPVLSPQSRASQVVVLAALALAYATLSDAQYAALTDYQYATLDDTAAVPAGRSVASQVL